MGSSLVQSQTDPCRLFAKRDLQNPILLCVKHESGMLDFPEHTFNSERFPFDICTKLILTTAPIEFHRRLHCPNLSGIVSQLVEAYNFSPLCIFTCVLHSVSNIVSQLVEAFLHYAFSHVIPPPPLTQWPMHSSSYLLVAFCSKSSQSLSSNLLKIDDRGRC